jgi:hypothetical protein
MTLQSAYRAAMRNGRAGRAKGDAYGASEALAMDPTGRGLATHVLADPTLSLTGAEVYRVKPWLPDGFPVVLFRPNGGAR